MRNAARQDRIAKRDYYDRVQRYSALPEGHSTVDLGIAYGGDGEYEELSGFVGSDRAAGTRLCRSTTGYLCTLDGGGDQLVLKGPVHRDYIDHRGRVCCALRGNEGDSVPAVIRAVDRTRN